MFLLSLAEYLGEDGECKRLVVLDDDEEECRLSLVHDEVDDDD